MGSVEVIPLGERPAVEVQRDDVWYPGQVHARRYVEDQAEADRVGGQCDRPGWWAQIWYRVPERGGHEATKIGWFHQDDVRPRAVD